MRKQYIFLVVAILSLVATLCFPLVHFEPVAMGLGRDMNALCIVGEGSMSLMSAPLLALIAIVCPLCTWALFAKKPLLGNPKAKVADRRKQSMLCKTSIVLLLVWYATAAGVIYIEKGTDTICPRFALILPFIAIVLLVMAVMGIKADERLVRSADRIR